MKKKIIANATGIHEDKLDFMETVPDWCSVAMMLLAPQIGIGTNSLLELIKATRVIEEVKADELRDIQVVTILDTAKLHGCTWTKRQWIEYFSKQDNYGKALDRASELIQRVTGWDEEIANAVTMSPKDRMSKDSIHANILGYYDSTMLAHQYREVVIGQLDTYTIEQLSDIYDRILRTISTKVVTDTIFFITKVL